VGYAGGTTSRPTYHELGDHTETLQVDFDPAQVSYAQLLEVFWKEHSPTSRSWSRQYKAVVFYHSEEQQRLAVATKERLAAELRAPITTEVLPAGAFTLAEAYHQKYYLRQDRALLRELTAIYPNPADFVASTAAARVNGYLAGHGTQAQIQGEVDRLGISDASQRRLLDAAARRAGA
jgi:methionine-S-sulfoxide reductase